MATSIESLGLSVEVQGVESANKALKQLVDVATRAEKAVTDLEAAADSAGKKTRELDKGASGAAEATRELDKGASGAADSTKALDTSAGSAAKSTGALDKGASGAAKSTEALDKGAGKADKSTKGMGDSAGKATAQVDEMGKKAASTERGVSSFASAAVKAGALLAAAFSVSAISKYADAWSEMQNKLRLVTDSTDSLAAATDQVYGIAQKTSQGIDTVSQVYQRFAQNSGQLGLSLKQVAGYTETVAKAVATSGASAQSANAALIQFGQGIASGTLRGEELNSVMEQTPSLAMAIAKGLDMPIGQLKKFASEGNLTSQTVLKALGKVSGYVDEQFSKRVMTIGQGFNNLTNSATRFVGMIDSKSGASAAFAAGLVKISSAVDKTTDFLLALGAALAPTFKAVGSALSTVGENATVVGVALAGFVAPGVIGGIASLAGIIGGALLTGIKAVAAAMLANPLGLLVAGAAAAGYAAYKFRDDIKQAVGVDVVATAKGAANTLIGSFAAAYEDIKFVWSNFGDILGGAVIGGVNLAIRAINSLIQGSISGVNSLVEAINNIPGVDIGKIGTSVGINEMDNPYAKRLGASVEQRNAAVKAAMSRDYVGDIGGWLDGIGKGGAGAGTGGGTVTGTAGASGKSAKAVAIEAETDAIKRALKDQVGALEAANEQNDYIYGLGIKSAEEYYARKAELGRDIGLAEAAAAEKEIEVVNRALATNKLTEDQRKKLLEDRRKLVGDVSAATVKAFAAEVSAEEAAARKRTSLQSEATKSAQSATAAAIDQANALALQVEQYDMTATAIANANVARADEDLALAETTYAMAVMRGERAEDLALIQKEIEAIKQRAQALRSVSGSTAKLEALDASKELKEQAKKDNEQIGDSLTDALLRGFEDGKGFATNFKDTLINMFKTMILKPIIQPLVQGAANTLTNAIGLTDNQGGSSFFDQAGNAKNLIGTGLSSISKYYGGAAASSNVVSGAAASEIGSLVGGGAALGGAGAAFAAGSQAAGAYVLGSAAAPTIGALVGGGTVGGAAAGTLAGTLGGAMSAIGAAMPYIGAAIAIYSLLSGSFKGEKRSGGTFNWADGQSSFLHGPSGGTDGKEGVVNAAISATAGGVNSLLKAAGSAVSVKNLIAGFEGSEKGRGGVMSGVTLSDGRQIGEDGSGSNYKGTYYNKNLPTSLTTEAAAGLLVTDLKQLQIEVLQSADDLPASLRKLVEGVTAVSLSDDAATALLGQISEQVAAVEGFRTMVESAGAPLAKFKDLSYDLTVAFVEASGGLEAAQNNLNSFYETYHTEAERMNDTLSGMTAVFDSLGLAVPATKEEFRALVDGLSLTDEAAVKARATLLGLNQTFAGWAEYTEKTSEATRLMNASFDQMLYTLPALASASQEVRQSVTDAAGGLSSLSSVLKTYYEGYYTEQERVAASMSTLNSEFAELGLTVPKSRQELRSLIESQDLSTDSGVKLYTSLLALSQSFVDVEKNTDSLAEKNAGLARQFADDAMNALVQAINTRKRDLAKAFEDIAEGLRTAIAASEKNVDKWRSASLALANTLRGMAGVINPSMDRSSAQSLIRNAANGGALPSQTDLENALGIVATPAAQLFNSFEDYMLDFVRTANDIDRLNKLTSGQLTIEEQALAALKKSLEDAQTRYEDEVKRLDNQVELQQLALQEAMGIKTATLSVKDATDAVNASIVILAAKMQQAAKPAAVAGGSLNANEQAIYNAYKSSGLSNLDSEGWAFWNAAAKNGKSIDDIVADIIKINGQKVNGSHANGLDRVPFNGYIAELHEGERVKTKAEARTEDMQRIQQARPSGLMSDSASLLVLQQILIRLGDVSAETRATAQNTGRTARLQDRWDGDGLPPTRDEMQ